MVRIAPSTNRRSAICWTVCVRAHARVHLSVYSLSHRRSHNACFSISLCKRYYRLRGILLPCYSHDPNFVRAATKSPKTRKGIVAPKGTIKRFVATRRDPHKVRRLPAFESEAWGQCDRVPSETEDFSTDFQTFYVPRIFIVARSGTLAVRPIVPLYLADVRSSLRRYSPTLPVERTRPRNNYADPHHTTLISSCCLFPSPFSTFPCRSKTVPSSVRPSHLTHFIANCSTTARADLERLRETVIRSFLRSFYAIGRDGHTYRSPFKSEFVR